MACILTSEGLREDRQRHPSQHCEDWPPTCVPSGVSGGYTYQGASGDTSKGLPNVTLNLYGYNEGEQAPGTLIDTRISDGAGFDNFYITRDHVRDYFLLQAQDPQNMTLNGVTSEDGRAQPDGSILWHQALPQVHLNDFFFGLATPTPTPPRPIPHAHTTATYPTQTLTPTSHSDPDRHAQPDSDRN